MEESENTDQTERAKTVKSADGGAGEENSTGASPDRRQQIYVHEFETAAKIFGSPQVDYGFDLTQDFKDNIKVLSQLYETIHRYLTGLYRKSDAFYPGSEDVYSDLQIYKRTINDKNRMPDQGEFQQLTFILAAQVPPFIQILREPFVENGKLSIITRYVAPTEKHPDKVMVAFQSSIRTSTKAFKEYIGVNLEKFDWEDKLTNIKDLTAIDLRHGRVDQILKTLLFSDFQGAVDQQMLGHIRKINQNIQRRLIMPLLQQLLREKLIISLSCKDIRISGVPGTEKYTDLLLINDGEHIERRYATLRAILTNDYTKPYQDQHFRKTLEERLKDDEITENEFFYQLSQNMLESFKTKTEIPPALVDAVVETLKISTWKVAYDKTKRQEEEKDELRNLASTLKQYGNLYRAKHGGKITISEQYLKYAVQGKISFALCCTDPFEVHESGKVDLSLYDNVFLLYRDRAVTAHAIDSAIETFEKNEDPYLLHTLENILGLGRVADKNLKDYVPPVYIEKLRHSLKQAYLRYLPWFSRFWLTISSSEISERKMQQIRAELRAQDRNILNKKRQSTEQLQSDVGRQQVKDLAKENIRRQNYEQRKHSDSAQKTGPEKELFGKILAYVNASWGRNIYPSRADILRDVSPGQKERVAKILEMVDVGAASLKELLRISIKGSGEIYVGTEHLMENQNEILQRCERKLEELGAVQTDTSSVSGQLDMKNKDIFEALSAYIRRL